MTVRIFPLLLLAALLPAQDQTGYRVEEDLQYSERARDPKLNRLDLYLPTQVANPPLVMFVHGGTWMTGSKEGHRWIGQTLALHGYAAAVINYSLSPIARFPAHVEDCAAAFAWLHRHAGDKRFDQDRMFVMGHSAGAHLVALLALDPRYLQAVQVPTTAIRGVLGLSGVYDVRPANPALDGVFGRDPERRDLASPFLHVTASAPPFLLTWADHDIAGLAFSGASLRERLRQLGVPVQAVQFDGENHVSYLRHFGGKPDVLAAHVFGFLEQRLAALARQEARPAAASGAVQVRTDLAYGEAARQRLDLYLPARTPAPVLLFAHGSLWNGGSRKDIAALGKALAAQGIGLAALDYAQAPDVYPAALQDMAAAFAFVHAHAAEFGVDARQLFVGGQGGGAVLALAIAQDRRWLAAAKVPAAAVRGTVALAPPCDLQREQPEFGVFPAAAREALSPLQLAAAGAPPLLMLYSRRDPFVADARRMQATLQQRRQDAVAAELPGLAIADLLATAGTDQDQITALLLAFVRR